MAIENRRDLSIAYTPGVAAVSSAIAEDKQLAYSLTTKKTQSLLLSDGSAVLGLGNIGAEAAMPVMEGKAALFKRFADVDAIPIVLDTQETEEIIAIVKAIAPTFGGINLEDISAPRCFEIEQRLIEECAIPIFHDDPAWDGNSCLSGCFQQPEIDWQITSRSQNRCQWRWFCWTFYYS